MGQISSGSRARKALEGDLQGLLMGGSGEATAFPLPCTDLWPARGSSPKDPRKDASLSQELNERMSPTPSSLPGKVGDSI